VIIMRRFGRFWLAPVVLLGVGCSGEVNTPMGAAPGSSGTPGDTAGNVPNTGLPGGPEGAAPGDTADGAATTAGPTIPGPNDPVESAPALPLQLNGEPLYARAVRLTHEQWENSVRYLLSIDDTGERQNLAQDVSGFYDFSNHEGLLFLNANLYRDYQMAAEELALAISMDSDAVAAIAPEPGAADFIETVGRRAFRRPLTDAEKQTLQTLYDEGASLTESGGTAHSRGLGLAQQGLLQSPYFLYRLEWGPSGARHTGY
jgi:hypothetical protein